MNRFEARPFRFHRMQHGGIGERGMIGPWTDFNPSGAAVAFSHVVLCEPFSHLGCSCPDDGIIIRIVVERAAKYLRTDDALLETFSVPRKSLVDDVLQELLGLLAGAKGRALENHRKSLLNLCRDRF